MSIISNEHQHGSPFDKSEPKEPGWAAVTDEQAEALFRAWRDEANQPGSCGFSGWKAAYQHVLEAAGVEKLKIRVSNLEFNRDNFRARAEAAEKELANQRDCTREAVEQLNRANAERDQYREQNQLLRGRLDDNEEEFAAIENAMHGAGYEVEFGPGACIRELAEHRDHWKARAERAMVKRQSDLSDHAKDTSELIAEHARQLSELETMLRSHIAKLEKVMEERLTRVERKLMLQEPIGPILHDWRSLHDDTGLR